MLSAAGGIASEGDTAIDASGALPSGATFEGVAGLKNSLARAA